MLERQLAAIPMTRAMQVEVGPIETGRLRLRAPLAANLNDKGCAFGGSLVSLMTLAGWALVETRLLAAGHVGNEVYVADSEVRYKAPLWSDLEAEAVAAPGEDWDAFLEAFARKGKARIMVDVAVPLPEGGIATTLRARYAAFPGPKPDASTGDAA